jgi:2-methylcitrate dehydratase PrpD
VGSATERLARYVGELRYERLPPEVQARAKVILLDTLGVMLAAAPPEHETGQILCAVLAGDGPAEATVVGRRTRTSAINASFINGSLGYYWDFESLHLGAVMHGPAVALPAALANAESRRSSGADLLGALVAGIDIACRASLAIGPTAMYAHGFQPTAVCGAFGAAAAAGQLLGLDSERQANAFGLAATQASGLLAWSSDPTEHSKPFNTGLASRNGVTAALLAEAGFGGPRRVFDADAEYNVFRAWSDEPAPEVLVEALHERYFIMELAVKLYPCCAFLHPALDAIRSIRSSGLVQPEQVYAVTLRLARSPTPLIDNSPLKTHCAQSILPIVLLRGDLTLADLHGDPPPDPRIDGLARRVEVVPDDDLERLYPDLYSTIVELHSLDGPTVTERVDRARGHPENPVSDQEVQQKFLAVAGEVIGPSAARHLVELVDRLDNLDTIEELIRLLALPN